MRTISKTLLVALLLAVPAMTYAQWDLEGVEVDRTKWRDYTPQWNPNYNLMIPGAGVGTADGSQPAANGPRRLQQADADLPEYWDNATTIHFPPVFNQSGGSCGVSSRVGYMLTEELNAYRGTNASLPENRLACNFQYPFSYDNGTPKDYMARYVGYPDSKTYGGFPYSSIYGFYEVDAYNAGWMQGYDKWYTSMFNRIWGTSSIPVGVIGYPEDNPEGWGRGGYGPGALAAKRYLYNHNGDESYSTGGLLGLGVACGGPQFSVPKTPANDAIGVTGKRYWVTGTSVDHAVTITGYDDRIEFDLDGNGIAGERNNTVGQDEKGAWIIVNSWGGWANNGFIYIPYPLAAPTCSKQTKTYNTYADDGVTVTGTVTKDYYTPNGAGGFTPEIYHIRKDYVPKRTIKLKMTFNQRSAISLRAGISRNLKATEPEKTITFHHFNYQGNGNNSDDPLIPMLGRWNDGKMHYEPMEFGYDLTDLTEDFDRSQPLKYFFIIVSNNTASGEGGIHEASIMDYSYDPEGVEIPFTIEGDSVSIQNAGKRTMISVVVNGSGITAPSNLSLNDGTLQWEAPVGALEPTAYKVYADNKELAEVETTSYTFTPQPGVAYTVRAVYGTDEACTFSEISSAVRMSDAADNQTDDYVGVFQNGGFSIPDVFSAGMAQATIEFRMKPTALANWNQQIGPNWGSFLIHTTENGELVYGWNTGNDRSTVSNVLKTTAWTHIAIAVDGSTMTLYVNGTKRGSVTSSGYSGLPGLNELVFGSHQGTNSGLYGYVDDVRIWKGVRSPNQIRRAYASPLLNPAQFNDLLAYYRMDTIEEGGETKLRDCVGGHHAAFVKDNGTATVSTEVPSGFTNPTIVANITRPANTPVGQAYTFTDYCPPNVVKRVWVIDGKTYTMASPTIIFNTPGVKDVSLTVTDNEGNTASATATITITEGVTPTAAFRLSTESVSGTDRVSFISENTAPGCTYLWDMPGALVEQATTINAAAQYTAEGTYTVKLTVTGPDGTEYVEQHEVTVNPSAPIARYNISESVVVKGQEVGLDDNSLYSPTGGSWVFSSDQSVFATYGLHTTVVPNAAGVFDLTYKVANDYGSNEVTQGRALVVCNADSKHGLNFGGGSQKLTAGAPAGITNAWTMGFWYRPMAGGEGALCITGGEGGITLKANDSGGLTLSAGSVSVSSSDAILETNTWHHYAITANRGTIRFYQDGVLKGSGTLSGVTDYSALWNALTIGGQGTEATGVMDELWVFNKNLANARIKTYCVLPVTEALVSDDADALKLYYDFNHSSGDAQDKSGNGNTGVRSGFGPDGDAWVESKGVFALNFGTTQTITPLGEKINTSSDYTVIDWSDQEITKETAPASYAIDGKTSTFWHSSWANGNVGYPHSLTIRRNDLTDIETMRFYYTREQRYRASSVTVEVSEDGENWRIIESETALANAENQYVFLAQPVQEPYIRITFTKGFGGTLLALNEITFYGGLISTDINTIETAEPGVNNNVWYDLQGRRVEKPGRGIYIRNGKKVFFR
ncbi:MAG: discoidin domain-containing protein [Bacteroidaceae bacterium]|nr:discoidin domain-containing protein [Bacteroidaceae bacterium]